MFKKKIKKDTIIHKGDFDLNSEVTALGDEEKYLNLVICLLKRIEKVKRLLEYWMNRRKLRKGPSKE